MNDPIKLAVIGGGVNSAVGRAHYCASRMDGEFEWVSASFSRDEAINKRSMDFYRVKQNLGVGKLSTLMVPEVDAVLVLTPTPDHAGTVKELLLHNKVVICEKSLAVSVDELLTVPHSDRIVVMYNYIGYPAVKKMRELIKDDVIGELLHCHIEMPQEGYLVNGNKPQSWRLKDGPIPMVHLDLGTHLHNMVRYLTGYTPLAVFAAASGYGNHDVIDDVTATVQYNAGFKANYWFGKSALGNRNGLRVRMYGSEGSIDWLQSDPEHLTISDRLGHVTIMDRGSSFWNNHSHNSFDSKYNRFKAGHPIGFVEAMANVYLDIAKYIRGGKLGLDVTDIPGVSGWESSMEGLQLMEAMVLSAKEGTWVSL